jgi:hypothetical protein
MIVVFFLVGAAVLLRARMRDIVVCLAVSTGLFLLAAVTVAVYIGTTVPTSGFGAGFNFAQAGWPDAPAGWRIVRRCTPFPPSLRLRGLHAHLASGGGADGLLAAAGRRLRLAAYGRGLAGLVRPGGDAAECIRPLRSITYHERDQQ